jgi:NAD(P)-dependent dehydrogenase (short-subunit alcohol dehydrogenase family)
VRVNTFDFSRKVVLVTGGSRGIGRATALLFAQSSAKVVIGDVDPAGSETVEAIKRDGGEAIFVKTDVSDEGDVKNLIATAIKTYGGLHCAFNNAGVLPRTCCKAAAAQS